MAGAVPSLTRGAAIRDPLAHIRLMWRSSVSGLRFGGPRGNDLSKNTSD